MLESSVMLAVTTMKLRLNLEKQIQNTEINDKFGDFMQHNHRKEGKTRLPIHFCCQQNHRYCA